MNKLYLILSMFVAQTPATAFDYIGKDPAPKDAQSFAVTVVGASPVDAFAGPVLAPAQAMRPSFVGNGFIAADSQKRVWRVTARHVLDHWSQTLLGDDIVGFRLNGAPANPPEIGEYREGYNVTIAGWIPENGTLAWRVSDARSRRIPRYRVAELRDEMSRIYAKLGVAGRFPDTEKVRIAEISVIGDQPKMVPGASGSAVYQNGKVVGVIIAGPDGHSLVSDGVYFELLVEPK